MFYGIPIELTGPENAWGFFTGNLPDCTNCLCVEDAWVT